MFNRKNKQRGYTSANKIELLYSGKPYFDKLLGIIEAAKHSIHLQVYILEEDETGSQIIDALIAAAQRGVAVYLMPDGYASQSLSPAFIKKIEDSGIQFRYFEPLLKSENFYFGRRLHHKVAVADAYYSLVTGINIGNRYNDMPQQPAWIDWALYCEGNVSQQLHNVCLQLWCKNNKTQRKKLAFQPILPANDNHYLVRVRRNDWVKRFNQISNSYVDMIRHAQSHIYIMSSYFIPGWIIRQQLLKAAKRGVTIKLIVTGVSDVQLAKGAECYIYGWFYKHNIEVYEYNQGVLHSKLATCDGKWATIGSYNVNNISAYASVELNIDVLNEAFAQNTEKKLNTIIENSCTLITPEIYHSRYNFFKRALQFCSYLIVRFLINVFTFYFKQHK